MLYVVRTLRLAKGRRLCNQGAGSFIDPTSSPIVICDPHSLLLEQTDFIRHKELINFIHRKGCKRACFYKMVSMRSDFHSQQLGHGMPMRGTTLAGRFVDRRVYTAHD